MKKHLLLGIFCFSLVCLLANCNIIKKSSNSNQKKDIKTITWQTERNMSDYQDYLNEVLQQKGYHYQIEFINKNSHKKPDILNVGLSTWEKTYDLTREVLDQKLICLDSYFETKEGKKLKATLPQNIWDMYKVNGQQYTILSTGYPPLYTAYIWDKTLAQKYQIHPETWDEEIWKYKEELEKVYNGENKNNFLTTVGLDYYLTLPPGYTSILGPDYPLIIDEKSETTNAQFLYDSPKYKEALKGISSLYKTGIYAPEKEVDNSKVFLELSSTFVSKEAYSFALGNKDFWKTHDVKILREEPLWKLTCCAIETGISSECTYPEDAFRLLAAIYTDSDLTNAILWGKKDFQFNVNGNFAVALGTENEYAPNNHIGNSLIGYVVVGQDPNGKNLYPERMKNAKPSKLLGFNFVGKNCIKELENIFQIYLENTYSPQTDYQVYETNLYRKYKEAGIDKVIAEWNREFQEWKNTQEAK